MRFDWISFTTDYGTGDGFVAACKGVIAGIAPWVRVLDVTHTIDPQDIRHGGTVLAHTIGYLPPAVHLAVVDPGVGTARRGIVVAAGAGLLVGPDNGLLPPAAEVLGPITAAHELTEPRLRRPEVSATFHGRDIFAPAAAHLAAGVPPAEFGAAIDPAGLVRLPVPTTVVGDGKLTSEILVADRFGNLQLAAGAAELRAVVDRPGARLSVRLRRSTVLATLADTFADVPTGAMLVHVDSAGRVAVAVNGGSAAEALGSRVGELTISLTR